LKIGDVLPLETYISAQVPLVHKLAEGEWFTARISAAALFAHAYARVTDAKERQSLRLLFGTLCREETPMVRRAACTNIGRFAKVVEYPFVKSDLLPAFQKLCADDQDSVRLLTVDNCVQLAAVLKPEDNVSVSCSLSYLFAKAFALVLTWSAISRQKFFYLSCTHSARTSLGVFDTWLRTSLYHCAMLASTRKTAKEKRWLMHS